MHSSAAISGMAKMSANMNINCPSSVVDRRLWLAAHCGRSSTDTSSLGASCAMICRRHDRDSVIDQGACEQRACQQPVELARRIDPNAGDPPPIALDGI